MRRTGARRTLENALRRWGFALVAGVDEVGRGCLAGPVVSAAVILHPDRHIPRLADSKVVPALERRRLSERIRAEAVSWAIGAVEAPDIDRLSIHRASLESMRRAVMALTPLPDLVLVDAFRVSGLPMAQRAVIHGDRRCSVIAAASLVAKVYRDDLMLTLHEADPRYGYDRHKGYGTPEHLAALSRHGYSTHHRRSFRSPSLFDTMDAAAPALEP
jgi:ribonuclease HII